MALRPQQYRLQYPLTPAQVESIDTMFETLFRAVRTLDVATNASDTTEFTSAIEDLQRRSGISGSAGEDGADGMPGAGFGGVATGAGTAGSVLFFGPSSAIAQDNANFFYDDAANRLELKSTASGAGISVLGAGANSQRFGLNTLVNGNQSVAVGESATCLSTGVGSGNKAVAIGYLASTVNQDSIMIGRVATEGIATTLGQNIGIGSGATFGTNCDNVIAIGTAASVANNTQEAVAVGHTAVSATNAVALGSSTTAIENTIALGYKTTATVQRQFVVGATNDTVSGPIDSIYFGMGVTSTAPRTYTGVVINATGGNGTDIAGADLGFAAGKPTGAGAGGDIFFSTAPAGAGPSSTLRNLVERVRINSLGNVAIGTTTFPTTGSAGLVFGDGTALATMGSNTAGFYANDVGGTVEMFSINEAGTLRQVSGSALTQVVATGRATAQTAAVASVSTFTVGAADGSFEIGANVNVTTSTLHNFTVTCAYTDETNTARTLTLNFSDLAGVIGTAITNAGGAIPYSGIVSTIRAKAATAITVATTGTFTTVTYNVEGIIKQVA